MLSQDFFEHGYTEWLKINTCRLTTEKRFFTIFKNTTHHAVYTTTCDEVDMGIAVMAIPYILYVTNDAFVNLSQALKLINDKRHLSLVTLQHDLFE